MFNRRHGESESVWALRLVRDPLLEGEPSFIIADVCDIPQDLIDGARGWLNAHDPIRVDAERLTADYCLPGDANDTIRAALLTYELELNGQGVISGHEDDSSSRKRSRKRKTVSADG
jgi:hypothetical protein